MSSLHLFWLLILMISIGRETENRRFPNWFPAIVIFLFQLTMTQALELPIAFVSSVAMLLWLRVLRPLRLSLMLYVIKFCLYLIQTKRVSLFLPLRLRFEWTLSFLWPAPKPLSSILVAIPQSFLPGNT